MSEAIEIYAEVTNVVVVIVCGEHVEWELLWGASHGGFAGSGLKKTSSGTAVRDLTTDSGVFAPSVPIVESSEVKVKVTGSIEFELLGDTVSE